MEYKSFAQLYCLEEAGFWRRLGRDLRLLKSFYQAIAMWVVLGRKVRKEYRRCQATGETFVLDRLDPARRRWV